MVVDVDGDTRGDVRDVRGFDCHPGRLVEEGDILVVSAAGFL